MRSPGDAICIQLKKQESVALFARMALNTFGSLSLWIHLTARKLARIQSRFGRRERGASRSNPPPGSKSTVSSLCEFTWCQRRFLWLFCLFLVTALELSSG